MTDTPLVETENAEVPERDWQAISTEAQGAGTMTPSDAAVTLVGVGASMLGAPVIPAVALFVLAKSNYGDSSVALTPFVWENPLVPAVEGYAGEQPVRIGYTSYWANYFYCSQVEVKVLWTYWAEDEAGVRRVKRISLVRGDKMEAGSKCSMQIDAQIDPVGLREADDGSVYEVVSVTLNFTETWSTFNKVAQQGVTWNFHGDGTAPVRV